MLVDDHDARWTIVHHEIGEPVVRRYPVPGGWLYQVSKENVYRPPPGEPDGEWHRPIFIPAPSAVSPAR